MNAPDGGWTHWAGPPAQPYGGRPPPPANPAARLGWRIQHSWWLVFPVLGLGCLGGIGFLYVGLRARRPAWWIPGLAYMILGCAGFVTVGEAPREHFLVDLGLGVWLAIWIAGIVHAGLINSAWLRWRAGYSPWYAEPAAPPPTWTAGHGAPIMQPSPFYGTGLAAAPMQLDVNTATVEQLAALPDLGPDLAQRAVAERGARSGFGSLEEFAIAVNLPPHRFAPLRPQLTCTPPGQNPWAPPSPAPPQSAPPWFSPSSPELAPPWFSPSSPELAPQWFSPSSPQSAPPLPSPSPPQSGPPAPPWPSPPSPEPPPFPGRVVDV